jgi:hypothetical protein
MMVKWAGHVAHGMRNAYSTIRGKPEGKRPFEVPRCDWGKKKSLLTECECVCVCELKLTGSVR